MTADNQVPEEVIETIRRIYSEAVADHALNPRNFGSMPQADGMGSTVEDDCGDILRVWLRVKNDVITEATFWTNGCAASIACGSMAIEMIEGIPVSEALQVRARDILEALGGLPQHNAHCAAVAADTVRKAIRDSLKMKNDPWKKAYRDTNIF